MPAPGQGPSIDVMLKGNYKHQVVGYAQVGQAGRDVLLPLPGLLLAAHLLAGPCGVFPLGFV